uniref:NADH-ubiquinone oxidoreductase chain 5 n=1 Tax=Pneumocystis canis TaxID=2698477 RepID=A0A8A6W4R9_9ASCO|nr:NADH dehydrogenase subunit 5 [Pneumocystis canis]QTK22336.1 NADH dehydrogenase subunit 5 [Pneumocystis canis]QTK22366.1 NADH dehydrogenase subunit 5 [Pneumocystis canis]
MYLTVVILPLLSGLTVGLFGRKLGVYGSYILSLSSIIITSLLGYICFYEVVLKSSPVSLKLFSWIDVDYLSLSWGFLFDELTVCMWIPVLTVSTAVQIYSVTYMKEDPHNQRFFCYLSLFTFFMLLLVSGDNYLVLFVGWEGVGILSFLLISFWYTRIQAVKSALSAILYNRVGDLFFILGLAVLLYSVGSLDFSIIFSVAPYLNKTVLFLIGLCFILAATGKSAQLGLHIWLPQAMEGPTPVSALIHAATMVTAGVYLMIRSSPLLEFNNTVLFLISWLGALTALVSSIIGLFQNDLKWIIAYSTCSQLGMMFVSIGLSQYQLALFHLVNHAFFKALLFLSAGVVIHEYNDEQDIRKMGGLLVGMPLTYTFILIGSLSLVAIPFLTGYYSKDVIIERTLSDVFASGFLLYWVLIFVALMTSLYSFKLIYYTFISSPSGWINNYKSLHDVPNSMIFPLLILCVLSIAWGYISKDLFIGTGSSALGMSIFSSREVSFDVEFNISLIFKILPILISIAGVSLCFILFHYYPYQLYKIKCLGVKMYRFFNQRCWLNLLYYNQILTPTLKLGYMTSRYLDKGALEQIGPSGLYRGLTSLTFILSKMDTGILRHYAIVISLGFLSVFTLGYISLYMNYQLVMVIVVSIVLILIY